MRIQAKRPAEATPEPRVNDAAEDSGDTEYPRIRKAVASAGRSLWNVGDAISAEARTDARGRVRKHEYRRISEVLRCHGYDVSPAYIRQLHQVTVWVNASAWQTRFRARPFDLVRRAKDVARSDDNTALAILADAKTKQDILRAKAPEPATDEDDLTPDARAMARDLQLVASASAQAGGGNGERIVGQVREKVDEGLRVLEDIVRATNNAMEHEPRRQGDIQAILRRLEERAPELIAAAVRAARGATEAQLEMEV